MQTRMVVTGLTTDPVNNAPIVILQDDLSGRVLPLLIGIIEASAIKTELEKVKQRRPMTHDLLRSTVEVLGGALSHVSIFDWRDNMFFSRVVLTQGSRTMEVEARPSDAIALALRMNAPIFCEASLLDRAQKHKVRLEVGAPTNVTLPVQIDKDPGHGPLPLLEHAKTSMDDLLENLPPETFGKYKM